MEKGSYKPPQIYEAAMIPLKLTIAQYLLMNDYSVHEQMV